MFHVPVCAKCQVDMRCKKNGVGVVDMADFGPCQVWDADLWECPKCGFQVVAGFGQKPIAYHYEPEGKLVKYLNLYREKSILIESKTHKEEA